MKKIDYTNKRFGRLTVIKDGNGLPEGGRNIRSVICKCDCGKEKEIKLKYILREDIKSCGCLGKEIKIEVKEGDKFGLWTVLKESEGYIKDGLKLDRTFDVKCVCGVEKQVNLQSLKKGQSKSCGCQGKIRQEKIKKEKTLPTNTEEEQWKQSINYPDYYISTKGRLFHIKREIYTKIKKIHEPEKRGTIKVQEEMYLTFIGEYDKSYLKVYGGTSLDSLYLHYIGSIRKKYSGVYHLIEYRCNNEKCTTYRNYGAKGIKLEGSFKTFQGFLDWVLSQGIRGHEKLEIDRIDSSKGYYPENCRFVTKEENILRPLNLTLDDVRFIRSEAFDWDLHRGNFKCSDYTIKNIIDFKTFRGVV
jgi:hypothetical protein